MATPEQSKDQVKQKLLEQSAHLFNTQGYEATSLQEIAETTGLDEGSILDHFTDKSDLHHQALLWMTTTAITELVVGIRAGKDFKEKMNNILDFFQGYATGQNRDGGCPLMNAAIETYYKTDVMREHTAEMFKVLTDATAMLLRNAIEHKQIKANVSTDAWAQFFVSALEGSLLLSKVQGNYIPLNSTVETLREQVRIMALQNLHIVH